MDLQVECACGCGSPTEREKKGPGFLKYVRGHRNAESRKKRAAIKELASKTHCACGCGEIVNFKEMRISKWKKGHQFRGRKYKRTKEYCEYASKRTKRQMEVNGHPFRGKTKETSEALKRISDSRKGELNVNYGKRGADSPSWKGGVRNERGYVHIRMPNHPNACGGYVLQHALVMEEYLGRPLKKGEIIHHINGTKNDNNILNLWLCDGSKHRIAHNSVFLLVKELMARGVVKFNRKRGVYELCE